MSGKGSNKTRKTKRVYKKKKIVRTLAPSDPQGRANISRYLITPDKIIAKLKFIPTGFMNNAGVTSASRSFYANGLFDVDAALGGTSVAGFTEWMNFYRNYRVLKLRVVGEYMNRESDAMQVGFVCTPVLFALNTYFASMNQSKHTHTKLLSSKGGMDRCKFDLLFDLAVIWGDQKEYLSEAGFTGSSGANPAQVISLIAYAQSPVALNLVNGVGLFMEFYFEVEFFGNTVLTV